MNPALGFGVVFLVFGSVTAARGAPMGAYKQQNLVADQRHMARHVDAKLINPWGIAISPVGVVWVADNATGVSTVYSLKGRPVSLRVSTVYGTRGKPMPLVVSVPPAAPTGAVFNPSADFGVSGPGGSGAARFIFATEAGTIAGWSPDADASAAILRVDNSAAGSIYKGLALGENSSGQFLYATDFHNGKIDVFDANFAPATLTGGFVDPGIPAGFAPFGIQNIGGELFVTYALQDEDAEDDVPGPGNGFVDVFDTDGNFVRRFASHGTLNSPWGLVMAPSCFGKFSGALLVGNFGDGRISAFDTVTGAFLGQLSDSHGNPIAIDGLWGLSFDAQACGKGEPRAKLFFTAGPDDETHGLFGILRPIGKVK
jgi:uncharacterized protein (TIGR03118 family)